MSKILYYFGLVQLWLVLQVFVFKTKTYYEDDSKPKRRIKGSAIMISNHASFWDGIVVALRFFFKRLHYVAGDFYKGKRKGLKFLVSVAGGIFVDRDGRSFDFIEKSKRVTAKGRSILVFPEGDFKSAYEPEKFSTGYIMLAIKTGARIVPVVNDFNYGLFKRVHLMIGKSIDLSGYSDAELTKEKIKEINGEISEKFRMLFYKLKRKKAERLSGRYEFISPKKGDVIRISVGAYHHYGVYLGADEVIQFGHAINTPGEQVVINAVTLRQFCGPKIPEVRVIKKRVVRNVDDIEKYAKSCLGHGGYSLANNNCLDFANRVTLKI